MYYAVFYRQNKILHFIALKIIYGSTGWFTGFGHIYNGSFILFDSLELLITCYYFE